MAPRGSLPRAWDEFDVYLFDIDGTLVHCADAVHYFAFCNALSFVVGKPTDLEGVTAHGNTDIGILRDAFRRAGVPDSQWRPRLAEICDAVCSHVEQHHSEFRINSLPCVRQVLEHLHSKGARLAVATGNLERIGTRKLHAVHLFKFFEFGAWSDALETRADVFARAVEKSTAVAGSHASMLVVGDTPADVRSAKANHLPVIAVATGVYSFAELEAEAPDLCIHSFKELISGA